MNWKSAILCVAMLALLASLAFSEAVVLNEPFASTGLAYTWLDSYPATTAEDLAIISATTAGIADSPDNDGYFGVTKGAVDTSVINIAYVNGVSTGIQNAKIEAYVYCTTTVSGTTYFGLSGRAKNITSTDPLTYNVSSPECYMMIFRTDDGRLMFRAYDGGWRYLYRTSSANVTNDTWHKMAFSAQTTGSDTFVHCWIDDTEMVLGDQGSTSYPDYKDTITVQANLGTNWGTYYRSTLMADTRYIDDFKLTDFDASSVNDWDIY